jgi:cobaltochelatase CobS
MTTATMNDTTGIAGTPRTYEVREQLRGLGCRWVKEAKEWRVPLSKLDEVKQIIEGTAVASFNKKQAAEKICLLLEDGKMRTTNMIRVKCGFPVSTTATRNLLVRLVDQKILAETGVGKKRYHLNDPNWRDRIGSKNLGGSATPGRDAIAPTSSPAIAKVVESYDDSDLRSQIEALTEQIEELSKQKNTGFLTLDVRVSDKKTKKIKAVVPESFSHVLDLAKARMNILLVGPAGCGKTHLAKLIAETLDLEFGAINCTSGMSEAHLTGRSIPNISTGKSRFQTTDFLRLYENGGVFLMDEIDAADSNLMLIINTAIANGYCNVPNRPEKPQAIRHPNFVLIATANTYGRGADRVYAGRNQLDEASLDRFRIGTVEMDFDRAVEMSFATEDEGNDFESEPHKNGIAAKEAAAYFAGLGYNLRGTLHCVRHRIEQATGLRRLMSTRFVKDALVMNQAAGWDTTKILEVFFQGWNKDELNRIRY